MKRIAFITYLKNSSGEVKYETEGSIGFDLKAGIEEDVVIKPHTRELIPTGIKIHSPDTAWFIYPRSGLAAKNGITLMNSVGVIDKDYLGEVKVCLFNSSDEPFTVKKGMRIAQGVINNEDTFKFTEVSEEGFNLFQTERNSGGFGSTGV